MELLFTNARLKVYTEVYTIDGGLLLGKHYKRAGDYVEFIIADTENIREILRTRHIKSTLQRRGDFDGGTAEIVHKFYVDKVALSKIAYEEFYGAVQQKIYFKEQGSPMDYRIQNLTLKLKESTFSESANENRMKMVERTLLTNITEKRAKRMNADYSSKLTKSVSLANRKRSKLTEELVNEIREAHALGARQLELGAKYDMSRTAIADILLYRTWNEHEFIAEDMDAVDITKLPQVPYKLYEDEPTHLRVDRTVTLFACEGFVYKLQQKVDFQVYLSKHLPTGELVSDAHLTYAEPTGINKFRNYIISYVRGNKMADYYMTKQEVYSLVNSYVRYI